MKNHSRLIRVFSRLVRSIGKAIELRLVIIGEGPLLPKLKAIASYEGMIERIAFVGFSDTPEYIYPGLDVFCFSSTIGESLPLVLLEAMSCECPVIATEVGGVPEILNNHSTVGWLIPKEDDVALLNAMQSALALDKKSLKRIGENSRARVIKHFNAGDQFDELVHFIETSVP